MLRQHSTCATDAAVLAEVKRQREEFRSRAEAYQVKLRRAFELLHEVRPIIGSDELHDRVESFLTGDDHV